MNMFKKNGGFTLVELIVVIAILAILAGIAIPAYSGYITKAQEAGDMTALSAIKTAVLAANAEEGTVASFDFTVGTGVSNVVLVDGTAGDTTDLDLYFGSAVASQTFNTVTGTVTWTQADGWDLD